ncbi:MAG: hypothetical protein GX803_09250 [Lentisphaerae bacterium]|jgi:hypothetical protein|nr:hypothetical protein [Lentisphaerota bacterium]
MFLPDRERLNLLAQDFRASRRAYPLLEIASRFLAHPDRYLVKLEMPLPAEGEARQTLCQCLECRRVFRHRHNAEAHVVRDHLDKFFEIEETEVEPPAGNFAVVARCGLSGELLGPPNHHGYNERIQELWSSRYAHMSKADYLARLHTVRDEALVEQWKESERKKTIFRLKQPPEGEEAAELTRAQAEEWMRSKIKGMLRESPRCIVPGAQSRQFDDEALRAAVSFAWQKESRFPLTLVMALQPAFRQMRFYLFKVNVRETFVTAVPPSPVEIDSATQVVREILSYLEANPGITRQQVLANLRPGADPESAGAAELLLHLSNLVAHGGVIEFFDGTLALPRGRRARPSVTTVAKAAPEAKPAEEEAEATVEAELVEAPQDAEVQTNEALAEPPPEEALPADEPDAAAEESATGSPEAEQAEDAP